jgi:glycosyltransferase involved in cell wall biosynthesis
VFGGHILSGFMKIAILTSGILPVPAVQGGAVETLIDYCLEYNNTSKQHDITVYSVYHPLVKQTQHLASDVNHYHYIDVTSLCAKVKKRIHGLTHRHTYYHYTIDYFLQQALKEVERHPYDIIILENRPGFALDLQGRTKAKLVYHLGNDFLNKNTSHATELYESAWRIITTSDYIRQCVMSCNPADAKCITVHNGVDLKPYETATPVSRESLGFAEDDFVLAFSGRLTPEKGIMELIEAMLLLRDQPNIKLLVMGSSFYENADKDNPFIYELKARAQQLGNRIRFTGYIKHELIPNYLAAADTAVIPSTWQEPFGLTVVEAMAAGLPIITTDRGGIPEIVSKDNAIMVPVCSDFCGVLAKAILSIYLHKEERKYMGQASRLLAKKFSKEIYAEQYFQAIDIATK